MPTLTIDKSLAEIVTAQPAAAQVFEDFGLDYCCGGHQLLAAACAGASIDSTIVIAALLTIDTTPSDDWSSMCPTALVAHLERTHHSYLKTELPRLEALAHKVTEAHASRHPELPEVLAGIRALREELEPHVMREERVLFPRIRELVAAHDDPNAAPVHPSTPLISAMLVEHTQTGALLAGLRVLTEGYEAPVDSCASYRALYVGLADLESDTHLHIHKENNLLFPMVKALEEQSAKASPTSQGRTPWSSTAPGSLVGADDLVNGRAGTTV